MYAYFNSIKKNIDEFKNADTFYDYFLQKDKTAVITIDMHKGHLDVADPNCPCPSERGNQIVEPINKFTAQVRKLGIPVINVRSILRKGMADEKAFPSAWRLLFPVSVGEIPNIDQHAIEGTKWNEFGIEVDWDKDYFVNTKKRLSAFYSSDLEVLLRNLEIKTIVLVGAMTDCCVLNTCFDGANHDFRVVVPRDLTRGGEHLEEPVLQLISYHLGLVVDSDELLQEWGKQN